MLQNLPIVLCCNSFEMSLLCSAVFLLCSHYAQFFLNNKTREEPLQLYILLQWTVGGGGGSLNFS